MVDERLIRVSATIFARNDEQRLGGCVSAFLKGAAAHDLVLTIIDLGSTDMTAQIAAALAAADFRIRFHRAIIADKAGAIDDVIHRTADDADIHIFADASIIPLDGAVGALVEALEENPTAYGATALAASGRSRRKWAARTITERCLNPQLFALSRTCIEEFRRRGVHLPAGWIGVGGLLAYLLLTDLEGGADDNHDERLVVAGEAHFEFCSLPLSPEGFDAWRSAVNRRAARRFQNEALYPQLKRDGLNAMPLTVAALDRRRSRSNKNIKSWRGERRRPTNLLEQHRGGLLKEFLES